MTKKKIDNKKTKEEKRIDYAKKVLRYMAKITEILCILIIVTIVLLFVVHHVYNMFEKKYYDVPGDLISIYDKDKIHAVDIGEGEYTFVFLPGMGTASPYYDYYKLATEIANNNRVIVMEPLGYGYSTNTKEKRDLEHYEKEIDTVLDHYEVKDNIIFVAHSYSGPITMDYANKHEDTVKGLVCLDCTSSYQIENHVKEDTKEYKDKVPSAPFYYSWMSPLGISRFVYSVSMKDDVEKDLLEDIPDEYIKAYKYLLYNKSLNKTVMNEMSDFPYIELEMLYEKYNENLHVITVLSSDTIKEMEEEYDYFKHNWQEMHELMIGNPEIQHITVLEGNHYIHHGNVNQIVELINGMLKEM